MRRGAQRSAAVVARATADTSKPELIPALRRRGGCEGSAPAGPCERGTESVNASFAEMGFCGPMMGHDEADAGADGALSGRRRRSALRQQAIPRRQS